MILKLIFRQLLSSNHGFTRLLGSSVNVVNQTMRIPICAASVALQRLPLMSLVSHHQLHSIAVPSVCRSGTSSLLGQYTNDVSLQQPCRGKARGNEYQPSNRKRKTKHGFHKRMKSRGGIAVIWRRLLKGRRLLSH